MIDRQLIVAAARRYIGTPYHHQAALHGAGCDCLGLVRGVWHDLYGAEPEEPPPYTPDWGDSDTRNYYDMISARQEIDLRPQLEGLDRLILRSEGIDPAALSFAFRPLWQMDAATKATVALTKAQATQVYAGLGLWPSETTARLLEAQVIEDGTYPGAEGIFAEVQRAGADATDARSTTDAFPAGSGSRSYENEPRDPDGRWARGGGVSVTPVGFHLERERRRRREKRRKRSRERERELKPHQAPAEPSGGEALPTPQSSPGSPAPPSSPPVVKPAGVPDHWIEKPSDIGVGMKWSNPGNRNDVVRSMPPDPASPFPHQQVPYIVDQFGGYRDVEGNQLAGSSPRKTPEAHIPTDRFIFKRP